MLLHYRVPKNSVRRMCFVLAGLLGLSLAIPVCAQMTPEQRLFDFQALASLYAKRYAPADWKIQAFNVSIFEAKGWADRVRAAKTDIEYFQIMSQYVASLRDGHTGFSTPSRFLADLGVYVDIYDGKVLIEQIVRSRLPLATYPFEIGDELVSLDGKLVETLVDELALEKSYSNPRTTRRAAADAVTFRLQSQHPRAAELPDESQIVVRRASGELETYNIRWIKTGTPLVNLGPVPSPSFDSTPGRTASGVDPAELLNELHNWSVSADQLHASRRILQTGSDEPEERSYVTGWGSRNPYYNLPQGFQVRIGRSASDPFYTGIYQSEGNRIGFMRIPNFGTPLPPALLLSMLDAEIQYMRANTDGLVVDVTRNTGGGCIGLDYAARLIPNRFWFFGEQLRPTLSLVQQYESYLNLARLLSADKWVIETYSAILDELVLAMKETRKITSSFPACGSTLISPSLRPPTFDNEPLTGSDGNVLAYEKPIIFLADEFSVSFGDIFPAVMQDNNRGPIVGMRTGGWGGSVSSWSVGFYSEASATNTNTLVGRRQNIVSPDLPTAPLIENIGVIPDIQLDYMTKENLLTRGAPFVASFTRMINEEIAKRK